MQLCPTVTALSGTWHCSCRKRNHLAFDRPGTGDEGGLGRCGALGHVLSDSLVSVGRLVSSDMGVCGDGGLLSRPSWTSPANGASRTPSQEIARPEVPEMKGATAISHRRRIACGIRACHGQLPEGRGGYLLLQNQENPDNEIRTPSIEPGHGSGQPVSDAHGLALRRSMGCELAAVRWDLTEAESIRTT